MRADFPPIADLLPHKGRAVLIEAVLEDSVDSIRVAAHITAAYPFFVAGHGVPSWTGIEMMAQAAAAHAGMESRRLQRPPRVGMLLGTRRYQVTTAWFPEGARLEIMAEREFSQNDGVGACVCQIVCNGRALATATLIIMEMDETHPG